MENEEFVEAYFHMFHYVSRCFPYDLTFIKNMLTLKEKFNQGKRKLINILFEILPTPRDINDIIIDYHFIIPDDHKYTFTKSSQ